MDLTLRRDVPFSSQLHPPTSPAFYPFIPPWIPPTPCYVCPSLGAWLPLADVPWPRVVCFARVLVSSEWEAKRDSWMGSVAGGVLTPGKHFCLFQQPELFIYSYFECFKPPNPSIVHTHTDTTLMLHTNTQAWTYTCTKQE